MSCKNTCKLCDRLILSNSVTFDSTANSLLIDIPAGNYMNGQKYCIVVAQNIPSATTISANVYITIGGVTTTTYPLTKCNCSQVSACSIRTRTKYSTVVYTSATGGSFRLLGNVACAPSNNLISIPVTSTATTQDVEAQ
jgi:hypothetical protein